MNHLIERRKIAEQIYEGKISSLPKNNQLLGYLSEEIALDLGLLAQEKVMMENETLEVVSEKLANTLKLFTIEEVLIILGGFNPVSVENTPLKENDILNNDKATIFLKKVSSVSGQNQMLLSQTLNFITDFHSKQKTTPTEKILIKQALLDFARNYLDNPSNQENSIERIQKFYSKQEIINTLGTVAALKIGNGENLEKISKNFACGINAIKHESTITLAINHALTTFVDSLILYAPETLNDSLGAKKEFKLHIARKMVKIIHHELFKNDYLLSIDNNHYEIPLSSAHLINCLARNNTDAKMALSSSINIFYPNPAENIVSQKIKANRKADENQPNLNQDSIKNKTNI